MKRTLISLVLYVAVALGPRASVVGAEPATGPTPVRHAENSRTAPAGANPSPQTDANGDPGSADVNAVNRHPLNIAVSLDELEWRRDATPQLGREGHRANHSSRRNAGSASVLKGTVVFYHIFVNDPVSFWPEQKRNDLASRWTDATRFIHEQGLRYDAHPLFADVVADPVTIKEEIPVDPMADLGWTGRVINAASGTNARDVVEKYRASHQADHVLIVLHVNKAARSYNVSYYSNVPKSLWAERLVCFSYIAPDHATPTATYAHEVLHAFGAGDLYFPFDQDSERYRKARQLCPDDVMFRIDPRIGGLEIAHWTAYRVGWLDQLEEEYRFMEDPG